MSSTEKTENLGLNKWMGIDIPKRVDFVNDNVILDRVITEHTSDSDIHVAEGDKDKWNEPFIIYTYLGNGTGSRTLALGCGFEPRFGIVYASGTFPTLTDFAHSADYNLFAIVSQSGSMKGVALSGKNLTVTQSSVAVSTSEYQSFNESGRLYVCIMFR